MKNLTEADIIRIMQEEWTKKVQHLSEEIDLVLGADATEDGKPDTVLSPELKIRHKKSGILYTVDSIGPRDVILRTPEGTKFIVDKEEITEYELS